MGLLCSQNSFANGPGSVDVDPTHPGPANRYAASQQSQSER